jgi:hypothetical protein
LRFGRLLGAPVRAKADPLGERVVAEPTSNGGRPDLLLEDSAEAHGGRRAQCCFAWRSGVVDAAASIGTAVHRGGTSRVLPLPAGG